MRRFKRQTEGGYLDLDIGAAIPDDMTNRHRREIDALVSRGEAEVLPADPIPVPTARERRRAEYAARLPLYDVIEALLEAEQGDRTRLDAVLALYVEIKARHPEPGPKPGP